MQASARRSALFMILPFLLSTCLFAVAVWLIGARRGSEAVIPSGINEPVRQPIRCVVIDAGHGGEDGGASSAAGLVEKEVNLEIAIALRDQLEAAGIPCVLTRSEDRLLYDRHVDYHGRKKVLDLAARRAIADSTEACLFVSIHMNAYPSERECGMQVWYGKADGRSQDIAAAIQRGSCALMPNNRRKIKAAGSNIYLLDRIECPAVLVECGFLSNPAEAERFENKEYRYEVATVIMGGILPYIGEQSGQVIE